jgi:hypothetical protein
VPDNFFSVTMDLKQIEDLARALDLLPAFVAGVQAGALHVKGVIAQYPPGTEANTPGPYPKRWYVRGYGPQWALKGGGVGKLHTSETLGRRWTIAKRDGGLGAVVGNNASYAREVQGDKQQRWHKAHGWKRVDEVAASEQQAVTDIINDSIGEEIKKRGLAP